VNYFLNYRTKRSETEVPLYLRIQIKRKKAELFLNQLIDPKIWNTNTQRIVAVKKSDAYINHEMDQIKTRINDIIWELEDEQEVVTARAVMQRLTGKATKSKNTVLEFFTRYIDELKAKNEFTKTVITQYTTTQYHLEEYLKSVGKSDILLGQLKRADLDGFEHHLLTFINEHMTRPMKRNTANKYLTRLKTVLLNAKRKQLIASNPFDGFKIKNVRTEKVYLTKEEIAKLENHSLNNNKQLQIVRDIFLFSVYTGLRFSDASRLTEQNIVKGSGGRLWIVGHQKKTKDPIEIPMLTQARAIYDKYEDVRKATGYILPKKVHQRVNVLLKEIMSLVGITKDVHHHVARHTFATTILLENGVDIKTTSKLMGHHSVKSTEVYAKVTKVLMENVAKKIERQ
jgi:site-specific recombinase XerD